MGEGENEYFSISCAISQLAGVNEEKKGVKMTISRFDASKFHPDNTENRLK